MRAAPPVDLPLSGGAALHFVSAVLHALALTGLFAWATAWAQARGWGVAPVPGLLANPTAGAGLPDFTRWPVWLGLVAGAMLGAWLGWRALRAAWVPAGAILRWDGRTWLLCAIAGCDTAATCSPLRSVVRQIDLDRWLLLKLRPPLGPVRWAVASATAAPGVWHAGRVALAAHAGQTRAEPSP